MINRQWAPAAVLVIGALLATVGVKAQRVLPLRAPLDVTVPSEVLGLKGHDYEVPAAELKVAGVTSYLYRSFGDTSDAASFSLYVGYYDQQMQGQTIHSPKNCLPGAGWEALTSTLATVPTDQGAVVVNRYLIQNGQRRALVLYWYQGRGRVAANEYLVKWNLLRDAAIRRRSDEALVRIVVPVKTTEDEAVATATAAARSLVPAIYTALPS